MRLEIASAKAIKYACLNFHYAKRTTLGILSYSVFNDKNEWCGVIVYGPSSNPYGHKDFKVNKNECIELLRMALNGKQESTSKAMALSLRLLKKHAPMVKIIVSYADNNVNHIGTIYQATNFYYVGQSSMDMRSGILIDGKPESYRGFQKRYGTTSLEKLKEILGNRIEFIKPKTKNKYIYPIHKSLVTMCKEMSKPYPKRLSGEVESNPSSKLDV